MVSVLVAFLPLLESGQWMIRLWDFPKLQLAVITGILAIGAVVLIRRRQKKWWPGVIFTSLVIATIWQSSYVVPFTPIWTVEAAEAKTDANTFDVLVVNLNFENEQFDKVNEEIAKLDPDVLILIEIDRQWLKVLDTIRSGYDYHEEVIRGEGLGLSVWSRLEMSSSRVRHVIDERRASIWSDLKIGGESFRLVAVHPTPPGLPKREGDGRHNSRIRDAELVLIAKEIARQDGRSWVVAGDFNDVAWSHTTRLFKRTSGLKDPRIGRSFMGTFHAANPFVRFPIDHVFVSDGFSISGLSRHRISGSDHFAVRARLALDSSRMGTTPEPVGDDRENADEIIDEGREDEAENESGEKL